MKPRRSVALRTIHCRPTWVMRLTNAELSAEFDAAYNVANMGNLGVIPRLDVLNDEISRRERAGQWTEEDWINPAAKVPRIELD